MNGRDAAEFMSMPIFATLEGKEVGKVKDILFDPSQQSLLGLMVTTHSKGDDLMFLERRYIRGIGKDAITIESVGSLQPFDTQVRANEVVESGIYLPGKNVITEGGDALGKVDKVMVADDGMISGYTTTTGRLGRGEKNEVRASSVLTIGEDAIIVSEPALHETTPRESVLADAEAYTVRRSADESMER